MNLSLREIEYILAIAAEENISRAARDLHVAQPSLSQALKKIERELGTKLFVRIKNRLKTTQEGELFVKAGLQINKIVRDLQNDIKDIADLAAGHLIIGMPFHLGAFVVPRVLLSYKRQYPQVEISFHESKSSELEEKILNGTIDLAVMPLPLDNPQISHIPFYRSRMALVMSKDDPLNVHASEDRGVGRFPLYDLKKAQSAFFIIGSPGQRSRTVSEIIFARAGIEPKFVLNSRNIDTIRGMASTGMGLALVPEPYINIDKNQPDPLNYYYLEPDCDYPWTMAATFLNYETLSQASRRFLKMLQDYFGEK